MGKVILLEDLVDVVSSLKKGGRKIVQCHGVFDLLHIGHKRHLESAKRFGDILVVTITSDEYVNKPNRPIFNQELRAELIAALEYVDYVAINEQMTAEEAILLLKPDVFAKGSEYSRFNDSGVVLERDAIEKIGGRIIFTNELTYSSTYLINRDLASPLVGKYLQTFKYSFSEIASYIERISELSILVIGENFIDEYQYGHQIGNIFSVENIEKYDGGSLAIYNTLSNFTDSVNVVFGQTVVKRRYVERIQKLFETYLIGKVSEVDLSNIDKYDLILVVDYGHGMITKELRETIKSKARFLAVNTKRRETNSIRKYWDRKSDIFICLNDGELRLATHEKYDEDDDIEDIIRNECNNTKIIVTTGYKGCVVCGSSGIVSIPAFASNVVDTVGAGDSFLSLAAPLVCMGAPMEVAGFVGNIAGAIACDHPANKLSITKEGLYGFMNTLL